MRGDECECANDRGCRRHTLRAVDGIQEEEARQTYVCIPWGRRDEAKWKARGQLKWGGWMRKCMKTKSNECREWSVKRELWVMSRQKYNVVSCWVVLRFASFRNRNGRQRRWCCRKYLGIDKHRLDIGRQLPALQVSCLHRRGFESLPDNWFNRASWGRQAIWALSDWLLAESLSEAYHGERLLYVSR